MFGLVSKKSLRAQLKMAQEDVEARREYHQQHCLPAFAELELLKSTADDLQDKNKLLGNANNKLRAKVREQTENDLIATSVKIIMAATHPGRYTELSTLEQQQQRQQAELNAMTGEANRRTPLFRLFGQ